MVFLVNQNNAWLVADNHVTCSSKVNLSDHVLLKSSYLSPTLLNTTLVFHGIPHINKELLNVTPNDGVSEAVVIVQDDQIVCHLNPQNLTVIPYISGILLSHVICTPVV